MQLILVRTCVVVCGLVHLGGASAADLAPAWPQANGPFGNFNPRQYGVRLIDDLADAKPLWVSEYADLGFAKGSSSGYLRHLTDGDTHPGSASGLIVAEGKVFAASFRPRGDIWPDHLPHLTTDAAKALLDDPQRGAALRRNAALDADDLTVAIDLRTGKTVWEAVELGRGLNRYSGKRLQFHGTPVYFNGRVFSLGTMGVVRCYDAADGRKLWEEDRSALYARSASLKEKVLSECKSLPGGEGLAASPIVADGVLVVPEFDTPHPDISLRGLAVDSGETLWTVKACSSRFATPAVWTHGNRQYVLVASVKGELRLIDPQSGNVLWTVAGLQPTYYSLSPSADHVCVNVASAHESPKKPGESRGRIAAYKLSPEKAELAWSAPDEQSYWFENHMDICAMRRVLIRDGRVYLATQSREPDSTKTSYHFVIFDEATGRVLYLSKPDQFGHPTVDHPERGHLGQFWLVEDRLLNIIDAAHSDRSLLEWVALDPANIGRLGTRWKPPHSNTTAYEVFIELPYVEGLFLMRTRQGQVVCYDLRRPN